jgi:hypothetical protein
VSALLLVTILLTQAPDGGLAKDAPRVPDVLGAMKAFTRNTHASTTACASCHATSSWTDVRFNHERTGFALTGRHARASCKACHLNDFTAPLARGCASCHRDVHAGELGARCDTCHDTADWRSRFDADAHRRTNFPLMGPHAALPCTECHLEARERRFSRAAVDCQGCHAGDALRAVQPVNHVALGLAERSCRECHTPLRFTPAQFPTHDACFPISGGVHAGVPCLGCHTSLMGGSSARCSTGTANCIGCHLEAETGAQHAEGRAPGYLFGNRRCLDCHYARGTRLP